MRDRDTARFKPMHHVVIVPAALVLTAALAVSSLLGDSITFDETGDLTAGMSYLRTGDFRLQPAHPPLAKMWAALPLLFVEHQWPGPQTPGWAEGDHYRFGRVWLFELNDVEDLVVPARCMVVVLLLATCLGVYTAARSLFGPDAGLLSLVLAALSPSLLAHGHLVTTDLPVTLAFLLTLLAFARLLNRLTWARLLSAAVSISALSLIKFSWILIVPAVVLMAAVAVVRRTPMQVSLLRVAPLFRARPKSTTAWLTGRRQRAAAVTLVMVFCGLMVWVAIWGCYGFRYSIFAGPPKRAGAVVAVSHAGTPRPDSMADAWESVLTDADGSPRRGLPAAAIRWARSQHFLPEGYLYGLAYTSVTTEMRRSYLLGEISTRGRHRYFPLAWAIKTPIAIQLLFLAGLAAIVRGHLPLGRNPILLGGLLSFVLLYAAVAVIQNLNIGHRHLLPIYPGLFVLAGASAGWLHRRPGRAIVAAAILWLLGANLWIQPHYLSYFNEWIGGPRHGHQYLLDSNIDWGQDLKRLARYAQAHPDEKLKLAYCGTALPRAYGLDCEMLLSYLPVAGRPARLTGGTYVLSVNQLFGLYAPTARDSFWQSPGIRESYRRRCEMLARPPDPDASQAALRERQAEARLLDDMRQGRLFHRLQTRVPDRRIGYSLFVYRLTDAEVQDLVRPW